MNNPIANSRTKYEFTKEQLIEICSQWYENGVYDGHNGCSDDGWDCIDSVPNDTLTRAIIKDIKEIDEHNKVVDENERQRGVLKIKSHDRYGRLQGWD